jgi:hypothetical protein
MFTKTHYFFKLQKLDAVEMKATRSYISISTHLNQGTLPQLVILCRIRVETVYISECVCE